MDEHVTSAPSLLHVFDEPEAKFDVERALDTVMTLTRRILRFPEATDAFTQLYTAVYLLGSANETARVSSTVEAELERFLEENGDLSHEESVSKALIKLHNEYARGVTSLSKTFLYHDRLAKLTGKHPDTLTQAMRVFDRVVLTPTVCGDVTKETVAALNSFLRSSPAPLPAVILLRQYSVVPGAVDRFAPIKQGTIEALIAFAARQGRIASRARTLQDVISVALKAQSTAQAAISPLCLLSVDSSEVLQTVAMHLVDHICGRMETLLTEVAASGPAISDFGRLCLLAGKGSWFDKFLSSHVTKELSLCAPTTSHDVQAFIRIATCLRDISAAVEAVPNGQRIVSGAAHALLRSAGPPMANAIGSLVVTCPGEALLLGGLAKYVTREGVLVGALTALVSGPTPSRASVEDFFTAAELEEGKAEVLAALKDLEAEAPVASERLTVKLLSGEVWRKAPIPTFVEPPRQLALLTEAFVEEAAFGGRSDIKRRVAFSYAWGTVELDVGGHALLVPTASAAVLLALRGALGGLSTTEVSVAAGVPCNVALLHLRRLSDDGPWNHPPIERDEALDVWRLRPFSIDGDAVLSVEGTHASPIVRPRETLGPVVSAAVVRVVKHMGAGSTADVIEAARDALRGTVSDDIITQALDKLVDDEIYLCRDDDRVEYFC